MQQPTTLEIATQAAILKLRAEGHGVQWIGFQKYMVDGERLTLPELLKLASATANGADVGHCPECATPLCKHASGIV